MGPEGVISGQNAFDYYPMPNRVDVIRWAYGGSFASFPKKTLFDAGADQRKKWAAFAGAPQNWVCPGAPHAILHYFEEERPAPAQARPGCWKNGMAVSVGRLRGRYASMM